MGREKFKLTVWLFSPKSNAFDWVSVFRTYPIEYVWWGPDEDQFGAPRPPDLPFMKRIFDNGEVTIYRVVRQ